MKKCAKVKNEYDPTNKPGSRWRTTLIQALPPIADRPENPPPQVFVGGTIKSRADPTKDILAIQSDFSITVNVNAEIHPRDEQTKKLTAVQLQYFKVNPTTLRNMRLGKGY